MHRRMGRNTASPKTADPPTKRATGLPNPGSESIIGGISGGVSGRIGWKRPCHGRTNWINHIGHTGNAMTERFNGPKLDELARKLADSVPGGIKSMGEDLELQFQVGVAVGAGPDGPGYP